MKHKRIISLALSFSLMLSMAGTALTPVVSASQIDDFTDYAAYGTQISNSLSAVVWQEDGVKAYSDLAARSGDSFLWAYGSYLEGLGARVENNPLDGDAVAEYKKALDNVLAYEATNLYAKYDISESDYLALNCLPYNTYSEVYYDDDVWIQKEFLNAYNLLGDPEYLDIARRLLNYIYRGWDTEFGGGIYWRDAGYGDESGKNTCINAPAAMASCQMYLATGDESYLEWAVKIYDWTKEKFLDPSDYLLWDNVSLNSDTGEESIDKAKYSYNAGCFISAAALLYQITGTQTYLDDAKATAQGAYDKWLSQKSIPVLDGETGYVWSSTHTWFNGNLVEGFLYLREVDSSDTYVDACLSSLAVACLTRPKTEQGWISDDWKSTDSISLSDVSMLQESATVRTLFMLADYIKDKPTPDEAIDAIFANSPGSSAYHTAVVGALTAYYSLPDAERASVSGGDALYDAMENDLGSDGAAAVQSVIHSIDNFHVITYQTKTELESIQSAYDALSDAQKECVVNDDLLRAFLAYQQQLYDDFSITVTGWASASQTPWLDYASEEQQSATRAAIADEVKYQYAENEYNVGVQNKDSCALGNYAGILNIQTDILPNDNAGNPWGQSGRYWAEVTSPFSGMSFSLTGYFSSHLWDKLPIGEPFTYNGKVYQQYWDRYYSYTDTPIVKDETVTLTKADSYPGYTGTKDATANTFRYAYAKFGQENKWDNLTLGIASENVQKVAGRLYIQQFEGPNGRAFIINTSARIAAVAAVETTDATYEQTLSNNRAFVLSGDLAEAFIALAGTESERLALTGAPIAEQYENSMIFENGVLTLSGFTANNPTTAALQAANAAVAAIPDVENITIADESLVTDARQKYDLLNDAWKQYVVDYDKLLSAEARIAAIKQEMTDQDVAQAFDERVLAISTTLTFASRAQIVSARAAYEQLNEQAQSLVTQLALLNSCEQQVNELFSEIDSINAGISALGTIDYHDGVIVRALLAHYAALTAEEQSYIIGYDALLSAQSTLENIYDHFNITVTGWKTVSRTPWLNDASDSEKDATRAAFADEVKYQYVMNSYNVGVNSGDSRELSDYSNILGLQTETQPNDNPGNPWGAGGRYWAMVVSPFAGMAFSVTGYFSSAYWDRLPLGDAFTYHGTIYQQNWDSYSSYEAAASSPRVSETAGYPGYDGGGDLTANTFRYTYAQYAQDHKWEEKTLGIPVSNAVQADGFVYQKFEGPDGIAYLVNTDARIAASDGSTGSLMAENAAYVITGAQADALEALGDDPFAMTGALLSSMGGGLLEFENGVLTATDFYTIAGHESEILDSMALSVSEGMVTQGSQDGRFDVTWNCVLDTDLFENTGVNLLNQTGINILSYGVYYGTDARDVELLINGTDTENAKKLIFGEAAGSSSIDIYNQFGFRLKNVPAGKERCAVFYLSYEYGGEKYLLLSSADTVTVYLAGQ